VDNKIPTLSPRYKIYGALVLGLTTAIAFRSLIVLDHIEPGWVRPVWYFAVLGNFLFFYYRFQISEKRKKAVREHELLDKISKKEPLTEDDCDVLIYLLSSIKKSPENINYLIIFVCSLVAIAADLAFVFLS
jgi:hypothetical protein